MALEGSDSFPVQEHLATLGVSLLCEWDILVFLYRHGTTLASAPQIARLVGHGEAALRTALDRLESLGLVKCSLGVKGLRLYRFILPKDPARLSCFVELISLADKSIGRPQMRSHLQHDPSEPPTQTDDSAPPFARGLVTLSCMDPR